jgi:thymidine kinase|tara:strand:- start:3824 stop:4399 length:576 start_codon:yes stop_codon:yes gene_type:complete
VKNEFIVFVGPMFGGKTTKLLSAVDRYHYQKRDIFAFKPKVDQRYAREEITTHWGGKLQAHLVTDANDIWEFFQANDRARLDNPVIAVDEAFMLANAGEVLPDLFKWGATVIASTLQISSDGTPYPEVAGFISYATKVEVCPAVCTTINCGADAHYTEKIGGRLDHGIEVGGAEMYQPRCFKHFSFYGGLK